MTRMTIRQKNLLAPFGKIFADMNRHVRSLSDDALQDLRAACESASTTNCGCCSFEAAKHLIDEARREQYQRRKLAEPFPAPAEVRE